MEELKKEINDLKKRVTELEGKVQPVQNVITLTPQVSISSNQTQPADIEKIISQIESYLSKELENIQGIYT
ncbi:hypothetical protein G8T71_10665 [Clostridium botulinum C/D]|nr:hypothetical protein [Clostridium botulinum]MCD3211817.1 hypothetical protein [Clostridium botulinum C/D]